MTSASDSERPGPGVQAGRARRRRVSAVIFGVVAIAVAVYAVLIPMSWHASGGGPPVPPIVAMTGAAALVLCLTAGVWAYLRVVDELEYRDNLVAFSVGFIFNVSAYVGWIVLRAGGLVPRLDASLLSTGTAVAAALAYIYLKLRAYLR